MLIRRGESGDEQRAFDRFAQARLIYEELGMGSWAAAASSRAIAPT
jgi:hypothetical protein